MEPKYTEMSGQYPGLWKYIGNYISRSFAVLKDPKQLLPTLVLGIVWMVLGIIGANVKVLPLPLWILSFLTFAQGGLYGGLFAAAGGIIGKVVIATFLNAMIIPMFRGKKPFAGVTGGISGIFKGAAVQGLRDISPLTGGTGAALIIYGFMNSRQDMQEAMVGIVSIIMLLKNIGSKSGFMTGLLFSAAQTFSKGRTPSHITVERILSGLTIGFSMAVALTLLPFRPCVWIGLILLIVSIILSFLGKGGNVQRPDSINRNINQRGQMNGTGKINHFILFLMTLAIAIALGFGTPMTAQASEQWVNPYSYYHIKTAEELFSFLRTNPASKLRVSVSAWERNNPSKMIRLPSDCMSAVIDLEKDAESSYQVSFMLPDNQQEIYDLKYTFTGDPEDPKLMRVWLDLTVTDYDTYEVLREESLEEAEIFFGTPNIEDRARGFLPETRSDSTFLFTVTGVLMDIPGRLGAEPIDLQPFLNNSRYELYAEILSGYDQDGNRDETYDEWLHEHNLAERVYAYYGAIRYTVRDTANNDREVMHQDCRYYMYRPAEIYQIIPESGLYPSWEYSERWVGETQYTFDRNGHLEVSKDNRFTTPSKGETVSAHVYHDHLKIFRDENGKPEYTNNVENQASWRIDYTYGFATDVDYYHNPKRGTPEEQREAHVLQDRKEYIDSYTGEHNRVKDNYKESYDDYAVNENVHVYVKHVKTSDLFQNGFEESYGTRYLVIRDFPELPLIYHRSVLHFYGMARQSKSNKDDLIPPEIDENTEAFHGFMQSLPDEAIQIIVSEPMNVEWFEPVWASDAERPDGNEKETASQKPETENAEDPEETIEPSESLEPETYPNPEDEAEPGDVIWNDSDLQAWGEHADTFDTAARTFIGWFIAMLLGGGVSNIGGSFGGPDPGSNPEDGIGDGSFEYENSGNDNGGSPGPDPVAFDWSQGRPPEWKFDNERGFSYKDPATGETMTYYLNGYDHETGEPQYLSSQSRDVFPESILMQNFETRAENASVIRQDAETGMRWQQEQHEQNQARWNRERETGITEMSEAWRRDQQAMKKEEYLEHLADHYNKSTEDIKGIKKEILKERMEAAREYGDQMSKEAWLEFGEETASQVEFVADTSINFLGEVTGPPGKAIKNMYNFTKPGMTKFMESMTERKDVYDTMTSIAQGVAEGAVGVLQNEVDGIGMAVGGDMVKTGLNSFLEGKTMSEIADDMEKTAYQSAMGYGIGKAFSYGGEKVFKSVKDGMKTPMNNTLKSIDKLGAWKNMTDNASAKMLVKQRLSYQKMMNDRLAKTKDLTGAFSTLANDVFKKYVGDDLTENLADKEVARSHALMDEAEKLWEKSGNVTAGKVHIRRNKE